MRNLASIARKFITPRSMPDGVRSRMACLLGCKMSRSKSGARNRSRFKLMQNGTPQNWHAIGSFVPTANPANGGATESGVVKIELQMEFALSDPVSNEPALRRWMAVERIKACRRRNIRRRRKSVLHGVPGGAGHPNRLDIIVNNYLSIL